MNKRGDYKYRDIHITQIFFQGNNCKQTFNKFQEVYAPLSFAILLKNIIVNLVQSFSL